MADFSTLKKKSKLGEPPKAEDIKNNLEKLESFDYIDGRTLRKTGRTHQLATRVTVDFYNMVKKMAFDEKITIAELLEKSVYEYLSKKNDSGTV